MLEARLGHYIRFILEYTGEDYLPYYIDGDVKLTQSVAILKYIARKHNLLPKTDAEICKRPDMLEYEAMDLKMGRKKERFYRTNNGTQIDLPLKMAWK
ncbi:hypothetical protein Avbf_13282 [Armadillidium vulgare]|nr:hypothetical protein Avbf_13282 [Armadillidium vulgare]